MSFSSFKKPFEEEIAAWDHTLNTVSEVIEEWLATQRNWLYLQPIFDSDDIKKQLPSESKRFLTVDKNWRQTMNEAKKRPKARASPRAPSGCLSPHSLCPAPHDAGTGTGSSGLWLRS